MASHVAVSTLGGKTGFSSGSGKSAGNVSGGSTKSVHTSKVSSNNGWSAGSGKSAGLSLTDFLNSAKDVSRNGSMSASSSGGYGYDISVPSSGYGVDSFGLGSDWISQLQAISDSNNAFNLAQVDKVNAFNSAEAQKNRDWQERLSDTAHQREVKDLIAAGLNPVLSAGGQGAITGSGAVASGQKAVADNTLANGVISIMSAMISASSAQRVAGTYAAAQMYAANTNAHTQANYQKTIKEIAGMNNMTSIVRQIPLMVESAFRAIAHV